MHVRFSTARGIPVVEEEGSFPVATVSGILIHPDTGKVEGFFVRTPGFLPSELLFLATEDILRWGLRVTVRSADVLHSVTERIRLQALLEERRAMLGQRIVTDTGRQLGACADVQFETEHFTVEWLWPRKLFRWQTPLPLSQILEVRKDAIVVRDPAAPAPEKSAAGKAPLLSVPETA